MSTRTASCQVGSVVEVLVLVVLVLVVLVEVDVEVDVEVVEVVDVLVDVVVYADVFSRDMDIRFQPDSNGNETLSAATK